MTAPRPRVEGEADLLPPEVSTAEQAYEQMKAHRDWYAEQYQATFLLLHPECPASPGLPNHCHHDVCDCGAGETLLGLAMVVCNERARLTAARLRLADAAEAWYAMPNGNTKAEAEAIGAVFTKACRDLAALRTTRKTGSGDAVHVTSAKAENGAPE